MGTHCYIAIEDKNDRTVRYVYVHYDSYFSHIVPLLRQHYMNRQNVERLIACGDMPSLLLPNKWVNEDYVDDENKPRVVNDRYVFEMEARHPFNNVHYFYLFKWECQSIEMFSIDALKMP